MDDTGSLERIRLDIEARRVAGEVLGIDESASPEEIKGAWRRACLATHPDRNPGDSSAHRRFILVNCAYRLLIEGVPCDALLDEIGREAPVPQESKYNLDNPWGMFLWWRDKFF